MFIMSLFIGLVVSLPLSLILLKVFRGRFFVITSPYFAGALYGFWLWVISLALLFLPAFREFAGIAMSLVMNGFAGAGFISGGILAALVRKTFPGK